MYKIFIPKGSIACLKLCIHTTIFWGAGDTSENIFSIKYVSMKRLYSDNNRSNLLTKKHRFAPGSLLRTSVKNYIFQAYLACVFQLT
jgi:hypothetical protein